MIFWIIGGLIGVVGLMEVLGRIPPKYRDLDTPAIRRLVDFLYVRGLDGARLHFKVLASVRGLDVEKRIKGPDDIELLVRVPVDGVQEIGEQTVLGILRSFGESGRQTQDGEVVLSCGSSRPHTVAVVEAVLTRLYGAQPNQRDCVGWIEGASRNVWAHPGLTSRPEWFI